MLGLIRLPAVPFLGAFSVGMARKRPRRLRVSAPSSNALIISGALKKKLGLTIEATRTREVGPNKTGAKGSSTVYRIVEPA